MTVWEKVQGELKEIAAGWDITDYDIDRPLKELAPKDGFRQFEPGDRMSITIHLEKKKAEEEG